MRNGISKWRLLALVAGLWVVADQAAKYWAVGQLTSGFAAEKTFGQRVSAFVSQKNLSERGMAYSIPAKVTTFWQHRYTQNRGTAWVGAAEKLRAPFFYLMVAATVAFILFYGRRLRTEQRLLTVALALLLGGVIGNGIDRVLHGYVIDFIDWHWFDSTWRSPSLHWPTFNIADAGITIGLAMIFLEFLFAKKLAKTAQRAELEHVSRTASQS
jgi:signal peptidase II